MLDFIAEEFMMEIKPSQRAVNEAAGNGMVGFLAERCAGWMLFPNQVGANDAAWNGQLAVLQWMVAQGLEIDYKSCIRWANGRTNVLEWLQQQVDNQD